jgi:hypothetical protein
MFHEFFLTITSIMDNADSVPIVSQCKFLVQIIARDAEGARRTQENFSCQCPVISLCWFLGKVIAEDADTARKMQVYYIFVQINPLIEISKIAKGKEWERL